MNLAQSSIEPATFYSVQRTTTRPRRPPAVERDDSYLHVEFVACPIIPGASLSCCPHFRVSPCIPGVSLNTGCLLDARSTLSFTRTCVK